MTPAPETVIVSAAPSKLPPEVRALVDPKQPLPAGVRFFEEVETPRSAEWVTGVGFGFVMLGVILIVAGITVTLLLILGVIFILAGGGIIFAAYSRAQAMRAQRQGKSKRYGVFLAGDRLIERNESGTTMIPRSRVSQIEGGTVYYLVNGERQFVHLPMQIVGMSAQSMLEAIQHWYSNQ